MHTKTDPNPKSIADTIYDNTQAAMQDAEEIWGMADDIDGYINLMQRIRASVDERIKNAQDLLETKADQDL